MRKGGTNTYWSEGRIFLFLYFRPHINIIKYYLYAFLLVYYCMTLHCLASNCPGPLCVLCVWSKCWEGAGGGGGFEESKGGRGDKVKEQKLDK